MRTTLLKSGSVLLLAACATEPQGDLFSVVRGTVATAGPTPVANAQVVGVGEYTLGDGNTMPVLDSARTDASGRYVVTLQVANLPAATVPAQILVRPAVDQPGGQSAPLMVRLTAGAARDTVVADV